MVETRNLGQYAILHQQKRYGASGGRSRRKMVEPWVWWVSPRSILDYGCGRSTLVDDLRVGSLSRRDRFDPAIPEFARIPADHYDAITCTDVMEHIEEDEIDAVAGDIKDRSNAALFCIFTKTAREILPSGENAHATVQPGTWWLDRLRRTFPDALIILEKGNVVTISSVSIPQWGRYAMALRKRLVK